MKYEEKIQDLFTETDDYYLAHCISADFGMGKGIVVEFNKRFDMKNKLKKLYPDYLSNWKENRKKYDCLLVDRVFNLITKERYFNKPTYKSISGSLMIMKQLCMENQITKIAMPVIGCGLDKLEWSKVSKIIKETFLDVDIEILICKQNPVKKSLEAMNMIKYDIDITENGYANYEGITNNINDIKEFLYSDGEFLNCVGHISFLNDNHEEEAILWIAADRKYGVYLGYHNGKWIKLSLHNREKLEEVVDVWGDGLYVSEGLFISSQMAWEGICEFVKSGNIYDGIEWIGDDQIPEDGNYL